MSPLAILVAVGLYAVCCVAVLGLLVGAKRSDVQAREMLRKRRPQD